LLDELHDSHVLEVVLKPGVHAAPVECTGAAGSLRCRKLPAALVEGVIAKRKKLANLDVAEGRRSQCGQVRLLDFHGGLAGFEVTTCPAEKGEKMILRRL